MSTMSPLPCLLRRVASAAALVFIAQAASAGVAEQAAAYAAAVRSASPVAYWTLDAVAGALSGLDASGNGYHATALGNTGAQLASGLFGGAAAGSGSWLQVPALSAMTGRNAVTVEAWVKLDAPMLSTAESFAGLYDSTQDNYALYLDRANGELRFKVATANGAAERPGASAYVVDKKRGEWVHVVGMLDPNDAAGPSAKIYLDGVLRDRHTAVNLASTLPAGQLAAIGADWNNGNANRKLGIGVIDQVAVYDHALTEAELRRHYSLGSGKAVSAIVPKISTLPAGFEVIGHRGNSMFAPENTLASNAQAIALGATRFETDVRLTKDGVAVMSHDDSTARTTGVSKSIAASNWAELQGLSAGMASVFGSRYADQKIPTLVETLIQARDAHSQVVLDVKVDNAGAAMARAIADTGFDSGDIVAFGWTDAAVNNLVAHLGQAQVFDLGFFSRFVAAGTLAARGAFLDGLKARGVDGVAMAFSDLLGGGEPLWGDLLALTEVRGLRVFTWTVNDAETMADLASLVATRVIDGREVVGRLDGLITDDPGTAMGLVSSVPEPQTWSLFALGGLALLLRRRSA